MCILPVAVGAPISIDESPQENNMHDMICLQPTEVGKYYTNITTAGH